MKVRGTRVQLPPPPPFSNGKWCLAVARRAKAEARAHFPAIMAFVHDADSNWRNPRRTGRVSPLDAESFLIHGSATSKPRPLPCAFYRTVAGNEPVREWLKELPENERKQVGSDIKAVQFGWPLGLPLVDSLGDGLWEVRSRLPSRIARTIFFVRDETILLLHRFIKKTRTTPSQELDIARRRKREIQKQSTHRK